MVFFYLFLISFLLADQKERLEKVVDVKKSFEKELQEILNLLSLYATTADSVIAMQTVDSKMEVLSENLVCLKV
jgi:succinate dehydrogenase hydrophobic anchor subunit